MKKAIVIIVTLLLTVMSACSKATLENGAATTELATVFETNGVSSSAGDGLYEKSAVQKRISSGFAVTQNDTISIVLVRDIFIGDRTEKDHNTQEIMDIKKANAEAYMSAIDREPDENLSVNDFYDYAIRYDNCTVTASEYSVCVKCDFSSLSRNASDEQIISFFKTNEYLTALLKTSGMNPDKLTVYKEDTSGFDENGDKTYEWSDYCLFEKTDDPGLNSYRAKFKCIRFFIYDDYTSEEKEDPLVSCFAYLYPEEKNEILLNAVTYSEALASAKKEISERKEETERLGVDDAGPITDEVFACEIVYDVSLKKDCAVPCYRFWFISDNATAEYYDIPCVKE